MPAPAAAGPRYRKLRGSPEVSHFWTVNRTISNTTKMTVQIIAIHQYHSMFFLPLLFVTYRTRLRTDSQCICLVSISP